MENQEISGLLSRGSFNCSCGHYHDAKIKDVFIASGAVANIPAMLAKYGCKKAFVLADENTYEAAGEQVISEIKKSGCPYSLFIMGKERIEPDERAVGSVLLHYDASCNMLVCVGSGVINDIGKIIAETAHIPSMIVGTAPSMDGYGSGTSSVIRDSLKVSVDSHCPDVVIGDLDILCRAPMRMIQSGIGDMLAKYISICEWRISRIINGEYYCDMIAELIIKALDKVVKNIGGVQSRDKEAIGAVMEGMVLSGIAANYAGISRPVSGMEHYFSHVWDMRGVEFGTPFDFHGIQCGIATIDTLRIYEEIKKIKPDREKAIAYVQKFDYEVWKKFLRANLGRSAEAMIAIESREHKYDVKAHAKRLDIIISKWDEILAVINTLPSSEEVTAMLKQAGAPTTVEEIHVTREAERNAFLITKDIRDKYVGSRLLWDLGELDNVCDKLFPAD